MNERAGLKVKIELWVHKKAHMEHSGSFCALFYINDIKVGRVDSDASLFKVDFKSDLATRIAGVDHMIFNARLENLLANKHTVLMN